MAACWAATASADDDPAEVAGVAAVEDLLLLLLVASLLALEFIEFITSAAAALRLLVLDPILVETRWQNVFTSSNVGRFAMPW